MSNFNYILEHLPYQHPFMFVDEIIRVTESEIEGHYTFKPDEFFYAGHFKGNPVTPGVILLETMAQIALVSHVIHLSKNALDQPVKLMAFTSAQVNFLKPVFPEQKVTVKGQLVYFRMGKIKSEVTLVDSTGEIACSGTLSGMIRI
jgi:3-hydroxyacyl-[acyl-carrier-protein] dehydratase